MSLYIDLTEFLKNPIKTGIQRVTGELCRCLQPDAAIPLRLYSTGYVALPAALIGSIGEYFKGTGESGAAEIQRLAAVENGSTVKISNQDTVLVPEVFYDPQRVAFFRDMPERDLQHYRFIVYDLLPVTDPQYFAPDMPLDIIYGYFQVIRRASNSGFISSHTRDVYFRRLRRTTASDGVVLPLGADAFGPKPDRVQSNRALAFSVIGTIEPRKHHKLILETFEPLFREIDGLTLHFIGKMGWVESDLAQRIQALAADNYSGFHFHPAPCDALIRSYVEQSRATIYISAAEGYGLPPIESLWLGTPVIASSAIPSLNRLGSGGIHYVEPLTVLNLRRAVLAFLDDGYANQKTEEAGRLDLPTWRSFTDEVLRWCA